jgi:V8-like Glu-specific endopeptidase
MKPTAGTWNYQYMNVQSLCSSMMSISILLALTAACTDEAIDENSLGDPPLEIEHDGKTYELIGPVLEQEVEPGPAAEIRPLTGIPELDSNEDRPLTEWSREELADRLRAVIANGDGIYVAEEPAWESADIVLDGNVEALSFDVVDRVGGERPTVEPTDNMRAIIGSDNRWWIADTTAAPHNSIVKVHLFSGNTYRGSCTGSYIGPWTLITAGHCLVFSNTDRINRLVFEPARSGGWFPYGAYDCRLDDVNAGNDYVWSVPYGYYYGQAADLDYAVIDTWPCHAAPRWFGGYMINAGNADYSMFGYTSGTCPWAPGPNDYQCGMTGPAYISDWRMETAVIDSVEGQSGAPWYRFYDIPRPVAVHKGSRAFWDFFACGFSPCQRNFARRIDWAVHDFIVATSYDY